MLMEKGSNFILFVDIYLEDALCVYPLGKQEPIRGFFFFLLAYDTVKIFVNK